jgi:hypothetical protein
MNNFRDLLNTNMDVTACILDAREYIDLTQKHLNKALLKSRECNSGLENQMRLFRVNKKREQRIYI